ncbi:MAG: TolC family protein [Chthoniobacteraceae bacterium]
MSPQLSKSLAAALSLAIIVPALPVSGKPKAAPTPTPAAARQNQQAHQEVLKLTLRKAIALAIENNLAIKVAEFEPDIAEARITTAGGTFDPTLEIGGGHNVSNSSTNETQAGNYYANISGKSVWGTQYSVGITGTTTRYSDYWSESGLSLTQPLLRGFGTAVNLASLHIARNNREISEWDFKQEVINVVTETVYYYNELYSALRNYEAKKRSRDLALELCKEEEARAEIGVKVALDVITAQAEAASREEAVILAKNDIENNERYLKQLITCDTRTLLFTPVDITPPPESVTGDLDVDAGVRDALKERPDYQQALISLKTRNINIVTARNGTLPSLNLVASLDLLGVNARDLAGSMRYWDNGVRNPEDWSLGAVFSVPLGNRAAKGSYKEAKLLKAQALVNLKKLEQSIMVDVAYAAGEVNTARKRIDSTQEALRLAQESLDAGRKRHEAGKATTYEVLQLQKSMTESEASLINAQADYRKALSEYDRQTGVTLLRNAVQITH